VVEGYYFHDIYRKSDCLWFGKLSISQCFSIQ